MDFSKALNQKAHANILDKLNRQLRSTQTRALHLAFSKKIRSDLRHLPKPIGPLVREAD